MLLIDKRAYLFNKNIYNINNTLVRWIWLAQSAVCLDSGRTQLTHWSRFLYKRTIYYSMIIIKIVLMTDHSLGSFLIWRGNQLLYLRSSAQRYQRGRALPSLTSRDGGNVRMRLLKTVLVSWPDNIMKKM